MSKPPAFPTTLPGGMMLPHLSARMRTQTIDALFEATGGFERAQAWVEASDENYKEFFVKIWAKGAAKAITQEHSLGEGVEDLLAKLDRAENATMIDVEYEEQSDDPDA